MDEKRFWKLKEVDLKGTPVGIKSMNMLCMCSGRRTGKSMFEYYMKKRLLNG